MSALAVPRSRPAEGQGGTPSFLVLPGGLGSPSLDDLVASIWEAVRAGRSPSCPVCDDRLEPRWSAGAGVVGAACPGCGAVLD